MSMSTGSWKKEGTSTQSPPLGELASPGTQHWPLLLQGEYSPYMDWGSKAKTAMKKKHSSCRVAAIRSAAGAGEERGRCRRRQNMTAPAIKNSAPRTATANPARQQVMFAASVSAPCHSQLMKFLTRWKMQRAMTMAWMTTDRPGWVSTMSAAARAASVAPAAGVRQEPAA